MKSLINLAAQNLLANIRDAICLQPTEHALVIFDTEAPLTKIITDGYRAALPGADFLEFRTETPEEILARINSLTAGDAVILVQSTNFRLNEFRLRIEMFKRGLKTIEHLHLSRLPEEQFERYIRALEYDPPYYRPLGHALKNKLDAANEIIVECAGTRLTYTGGMEPTKLNIGDYTGMKNVGGSFPIGEVFTEAKDLTQVNGAALVFGFAGDDHRVRIVTPFRVEITKGILEAGSDAPPEFTHIIDLIKADEEVLVRELGLGLNPAMGKHALVSDITAFERQKGVHLSLGEKHAIYAKPGLHRRKGRYHIDIFVDVEKILVDGQIIFLNESFHV
ncbi:MAG: hypothetical protein A3C15_02700 [Candidatus Magasanikbacteria bacterium RIFCSPHIGHO2_02_FULL_50_9b]|uniref:Uncharacterized protein n=1 Tax=Candidatus Magasanikbacteria bacterium RIFCSPHIGHO2_02_FULL_50_9b TaxID=1798682 RepID=A0A1F6M7S7_9BACT|nr:MAG: hypothetical protein A3C15_02700 [Candidatus Magasanikbacteria bacterium RIFCSPHIGHO2_02_FULL_50_9b]